MNTQPKKIEVILYNGEEWYPCSSFEKFEADYLKENLPSNTTIVEISIEKYKRWMRIRRDFIKLQNEINKLIYEHHTKKD
jgi:hypothetical protein